MSDCDPLACSTSDFPLATISLNLLKLMSIELVIHPTISFWVTHFSSCPQSFPASVSFPMSRLFASDGQSIGSSASTSVLPINIQDWYPLGLIGLISLQSKRLLRAFSNTTDKSINCLALSLLYGPALTSVHESSGKTIALTSNQWGAVFKLFVL